ncbi:MAG: PaaI family thioesterase [Xanthobacteraceae bacterium]|nr:PaaI family thioesterase [Xanthobacteraceae bacterium]
MDDKEGTAVTQPTETVPAGFARNPRRSPLTDPWEPIYWKEKPDAVILALRLAAPHTNARGLIHGGLIAAMADKAMGHSCSRKLGGTASLVTISLSVDYIGGARIGQWLAVDSEVLKTGSTICFVQCAVTADNDIIARANATFRAVKRK